MNHKFKRGDWVWFCSWTQVCDAPGRITSEINDDTVVVWVMFQGGGSGCFRLDQLAPAGCPCLLPCYKDLPRCCGAQP